MWFLFGFITIFLFFSLSMWMRVRARWKGTRETTGKHAYLRHLATHKGSVQAYYVGVDAPSHLSFVFKRESWVDRLFKGVDPVSWWAALD